MKGILNTMKGIPGANTHKPGLGDFPGGPVVKNPPCNAGDMGSIPGLRSKTPHSVERLSLFTATTGG